MLKRRPALRFVLLFATGILLSEWVSLPSIWLLSLSIVLVLLSAILFWLKKQQFVAVISLHCSVVLLGFLLQTLQHLDFKSRELEPSIDDESVTLFGTIDSEPIRRDRRMSCVVRTDSVFRVHSIEQDSRRVMVMFRLDKGEIFPENMEFGKKIKLRGSLEPFPFQRNPGEFDYGKYLALNDIQGVILVKGLCELRVNEHKDDNSLKAWTYSVQRSLYHIIDSLHSPQHAGFLKGIIFGYCADIQPDVKQSFLDTGTIHILAVSGSNVAFVAFIFFSLFGFFRLSRRAIGGAAIAGLIVYMLLTGSSPSVVRATIMAIVILCGTLFEHKADIYNSISVAAMILLLWNTNTLFDVGFQLSFSAVISIVYFYPRLELLIKKIPERFEEIKFVDGVLKLFAVSLAAQLGTIPFTAYYFNRVSFISLIANIPVVPISGLNTFIGSAEVMFYFISPWIAKLYAASNDFLIWFLLGFVKHAASVSFAYIETWHVSSVLAIGYYVAVFGVFNAHRVRVRAWILILLLVVGNVILFSDLWTRAHTKLTVTMIDVGQGDAILMECPNGKRILVDAGPWSMRFNAGERTVVPFVKRQGNIRVDYLLITHSHSDHIGGARSILQSIRVDTLVINYFDSDNRQVREILQVAQEKNVGLKTMYAGDQIPIDPNVRMYVLYPQWNRIAEKNLNNTSIVLKVIFGNASMLLVGDAEAEAEHKLILRYKELLSSGVLKVGHHGGLSSTSEEFLNIVHPQKALISVGNHNKFRLPSSFTVRRLMTHAVEIERTDKSGAIILENDGNQWVQRVWR
ncbi:MAG: DNA internalization-related competence protein ComEC/Rec2 [Bacteroidota bacterium]